MQLKNRTSVLLALMGVIFTPFAQAHIITTGAMGLLSRLVHPLTGADHMHAAIAAGIRAAVSGGSRARSVIAAFPGILGLGTVAGFAGASLGLVEPVIVFGPRGRVCCADRFTAAGIRMNRKVV